MKFSMTRLAVAAGVSVAATAASFSSPSFYQPKGMVVEAPRAADQDQQCDRRNFRVVIDVGHSEASPGALSARGVSEYRFNSMLAQAVAETLRRDGFLAVTVVSNQGAGKADLATRNARANSARPQAFLSLHHDSVQKQYLQTWTTEFGIEQSFSDKFSGYSIFVSNKNAFPQESVVLAEFLGEELVKRGLSSTKHHAEKIPGEGRPWVNEAMGIYRMDNLVVLRGTKAPAALLEAGVIVNRAEELQLASSRRRALVAEAISGALVKFCAAQAPSTSARR